MIVSVLGPAAIAGSVLRSRRQARLLSALALDLGAAVSHDRLVEHVWQHDLPADPAAALHTVVSRLRAALPEGVDIAPTAGSYRLDAEHGTVDLHLVEDWRQRGPTPDPATMLESATSVLALYRGVPFEALDGVDAIVERERLLETRCQLVEARADALFALGRADDATAVLTALVDEHPTRERAVARLMRACYAAGRQTEALAAAAALRAILRDEFGLEPTNEIAKLELAILDHTVDVSDTSDGPVATIGHHLPARPMTSFVGRDDDVEQVVRLVRAARLVTILGPGGIGKTRLALEVAHALAGEGVSVAYVELVDLGRGADVADVADVVAEALDAPLSGALDRLDAVARHLASARSVIVIDNCEHVVDAVREAVATLLPECAGVTVVATSRMPLGVDGEQRWPLHGLGPDAAQRLFNTRAAAADPSAVADDDADAVALLCNRLDGVPLSIEIAAAALATAGLDEVVGGLDRPLHRLTDIRQATAPRHRSVRAVIEWSYDLLDADEQAALDRLGVFAGSFRTDDVAALCGSTVVAHLPALVERSLVRRVAGSRPTRYELLETLRAFARERRGIAFDEDLRAHAMWAVDLARRGEPDLIGPREVEQFRTLRLHMANFRQAYEWLCRYGNPHERADLVRTLVIWGWQCDESEVMRWAIETSAALADEQTPAGVNAGAAALVAMSRGGALDHASAVASRAVERAQTSPPEARAFACYGAAEIAIFSGRFVDAARLGEQAAIDAAGAGCDGLAFFGSVDAALAHTYRGDRVQAEQWLHRASDLAVSLDSQLARAWIELCRADAAQDVAPDRARLHFERCIGSANPETSSFLIGVADMSRNALLERGVRGATDLVPYASLLAHWRDAQAWTFVVSVMRRLVADLVVCGDFDDAAVFLGVVLAAGGHATDDVARLTDLRGRIEAALGATNAADAIASGARLTIHAAAERAIRLVQPIPA